MTVKRSGLDAVLRDLERTIPEQADKLAGELRLDVAKAIAEGARDRTPVDTGRLRAAIKARRAGSDDTAAEVYVERGGKRDAFYWRFLEYGQGPDGIEHAMFLKAKEVVFGDQRFVDRFKRKLTSLLKKV